MRALEASLPSTARCPPTPSLVSGFQVSPPDGTAIGGDEGYVSCPRLQQNTAPAHSGALGESMSSEQPSGTGKRRWPRLDSGAFARLCAPAQACQPGTPVGRSNRLLISG